MARSVKNSSRTHLVLAVTSLSEYFDYDLLFERLVRRYGAQSPSSSFTTQGSPKSFLFSCEVPRSKVAKFKADWKIGTSDLNEKQKERLSPALAHAFKQLHDQIGDDDFQLIVRTLKRKSTIAWLLSCAADHGR